MRSITHSSGHLLACIAFLAAANAFACGGAPAPEPTGQQTSHLGAGHYCSVSNDECDPGTYCQWSNNGATCVPSNYPQTGGTVGTNNPSAARPQGSSCADDNECESGTCIKDPSSSGSRCGANNQASNDDGSDDGSGSQQANNDDDVSDDCGDDCQAVPSGTKQATPAAAR